MRYLPNTGNPVATFTLAVDREYKGKDGVTADFFSVQVWGKSAENCANYLAKGRLCAVRGAMQINNYIADDGTKRNSLRVNAERVQFLEYADRKRADDTAPAIEGYEALPDDETPF